MSILERYVVIQEIQTFMKVYPSFTRLFKYVNPVHINRFDWGARKNYQGDKKKNSKYVVDPEEAERQSLWRAKTNFMDIALSNEFNLFVTFTFAKNRYDVDLLKRKMAYWLNNQRLLHGNFGYLIVAEYHKDGALHFHALFQGYKGEMKSSGIFIRGREVFNVKSYRAVTTVAYKIDNLRKTAAYVAKYLTKEMPKFKRKLIDPYYAGITKISTWDVTGVGLHKAMIYHEEHERLKDIVLENPKKFTRQKHNPNFQMSSITDCEDCASLNIKTGKFVGYRNHNGNYTGNRKYYERYTCRSCKLGMTKADLHKQMVNKNKQMKTSQPVKDELKTAM